jgi:hypothetical protein
MRRTYILVVATLLTLTLGCEGATTVSQDLWLDESGSTAQTNAAPPEAPGTTPVNPGGAVLPSADMGTDPMIADAAADPPDLTMETDPIADLPQFSFFVTSLAMMQELSGSQDGFGGDLGGLEGADQICQSVAEGVGFGAKTWRAFLSVTDGGDGTPVHAIERIGDGPWFDANGRMVASSIDGLLNERPDGDPQTIEDLPDENGVPISLLGDAHDTLTGSDTAGMLASTNPATTCNDWTSTTVPADRIVMAGHSWPRSADSGREWASDHAVPGCAAGVNLEFNGAGSGDCVGCSGGFGGIYCFALQP